MTTGAGAPPRSLIVTSNSHGELALAVSLLRDAQFSGGAQLALPTALYELNRDTLPAPAIPYATSTDLIQAIDTQRPDLVFLFSAYLFSFDELMSQSELRALLEHLRAAGCRIVTSDPFFGLAKSLVLKDADPRLLLPRESPWKRRLASGARAIAGSRLKVVYVPDMDDVTHLYPTCVPDTQDDVRRVSFFNPAVRRAASAASEAGVDASAGSSDRWVFLMSETDLHVQRATLALRDLIEDLLGMLRLAAAEGKRPTLVAPALVLDALSRGVPDGAELLQWLPLAEFDERILEAEHVFSWSAISYTQMTRVVNDRSFFAFDRGYLLRVVPPVYQAAIDCHLTGLEPRYLDQRQLFSAYVLDHLAKAQRADLQVVKEAWQRAPTPDELVSQLLA